MQKTAYEVRISDWSSDVCSSDLATHSVVLAYLLLDYPRGPIFLSPLIAFFSAVLLGRRVGAWIVLAIGFVASVMLPPVLGDVIGRASCRARVCQYVYISVVAVSLKKQLNVNYPITAQHRT